MTALVTTLVLAAIAPLGAQQSNGKQSSGKQGLPSTMTKMVVRLTGPGIRSGSFPALPRTVYRAGERYARLEDPPDARQHVQKLTVINGRNAYSANLIDKTGTHAIEPAASHDLHLPVVLPFDPKHRLGPLDGLEFGVETDFFQSAGAHKEDGPQINGKPTTAYVLQTPSGAARLVVRGDTETPVFLTWPAPDGEYRYEYITYQDAPFDASLFAKPSGVRWKEIPPDPDSAAPGL